MSTSAQPSATLSPGWSLALGVLLVIAGIMALLYPVVASITAALYIGWFALIAAMTVLNMVFSFNAGSFYAGLAESLPKTIRGSGFGTVYSVSIAAFGGTTQLVITWLIHLTGEEFPSDCLGARNLCQRLIEGSLRLHLPDGGARDLSRVSVQGIYVLDGDTVKICFSHAGNARPTEFTTNGSDDKMITLKRAKE